MKKTFLAKRNKLLSSADVSWGVLALACVIILLFVRIIAPNFFWHAFAPVFRSADNLSAKSHSFFQNFGDTAALAVRNEKLQNENIALENENQTLSQKLANISALFNSEKVSTGILAGIVARPPESPYDTLLLAVGKNEGVVIGQEAFGDGGVPVGVVSSVLADFSRVTLFSAPNTSTAGWVGHANIPITIFGVGGGAMNASTARSAGIAVGDIVYVPGPGMLPIGNVARIDSDSSSPSITLRIQPTLNIFSISWVLLRGTVPAQLISATSTFL